MKLSLLRKIIISALALAVMAVQGVALTHKAESVLDDHSHSHTDCSINCFSESVKLGASYSLASASDIALGLFSALLYQWSGFISINRVGTDSRAPPYFKVSV